MRPQNPRRSAGVALAGSSFGAAGSVPPVTTGGALSPAFERALATGGSAAGACVAGAGVPPPVVATVRHDVSS
jgi:hypothetical protein